MLRQQKTNLFSITLVFFVCLSMTILFSCSPQEEKDAATNEQTDTTDKPETEQTVITQAPETETTEAEAKPLIEAANAIAVIETAKGKIEFEFYATDAPNASKNFIKNASKGLYKNSSFHTVEELYIQAGSDFVDETLPFEKGEQALEKGVILQIAKEDDANVSDGEEFLICKDVVELESDFTVLGKVTNGLEVLDSIEKDDKIVNITIRERDTKNTDTENNEESE